MIFTFVKAMVIYQWAKLRGYKILASDETQNSRWDHCLDCPYFDAGQCRRCGCLLTGKIMLNTEQCPDKRWRRVWQKPVTVK